LLAAIIRVHEGWPVALHGFPFDENSPAFSLAADGYWDLASWAGPVLFLAAGLVTKSFGERQVALTAALGVAAPLAMVLLVVGFTIAAVGAAGYYQPSLPVSFTMALWGKASASALPPRVMLVLIPTFGAARFGLRALAGCARYEGLSHRAKSRLFEILVVFVIWAVFRSEYYYANQDSLGIPGMAIMAAAAVLTVDAVLRTPRIESRRRVDYPALVAMGVGIAVGARWMWEMYQPDHLLRGVPWLIAAYAAAFVTMAAGRLITRQKTSA